VSVALLEQWQALWLQLNLRMCCYWARSDAGAVGANALFAVPNIPTGVDLPEQPLLAVQLIQLWLQLRRWVSHLPELVDLQQQEAVLFEYDDVSLAPVDSLWLPLHSRLTRFPGLLLIYRLAALFQIPPELQLFLDLLQG
jgi:hypothetical protein